MQTGFFLFTVGGAFLCRHNVPAFIGGCFPFAYADAYLFGLFMFISCILLFARKAFCCYLRLSSLHFTFRTFLYLSASVFSQQTRRIFSRLCSVIAFSGKATPYYRRHLLSSFLFAKFCCTNLRLFFRQTRRIFSRLCSLIAFLAKRTPATVCVDRHIFLPSERSCNFLCFLSSPALVLIYGRFMYSDCILLLVKQEPFFSCECHCDRPMFALIIVRFFPHKTFLVFLQFTFAYCVFELIFRRSKKRLTLSMATAAFFCRLNFNIHRRLLFSRLFRRSLYSAARLRPFFFALCQCSAYGGRGDV